MTNPYDPRDPLHEAYAQATGQATADRAYVDELDAERDAAEEPPRTWRPVDPGPYLTGNVEHPQPTVGHRTDGRGLFYPGRIHTVAGESEAGKGWLAVAVIVAELDAGHGALVVDFEDEPGTWYGRLLAAGGTREQLRDRFGYIRPEEPIGSVRSLARGDLGQALSDLGPSFVLLDGTTDAMTLHGLDPLSNKDAAAFGRMLPRWVARRGPAVVASDHVTKDRDGRGRYAIGAVHKLNAVDGGAYVIENRRPFGIGLTGRSTLLLAKDRPGALRQHALPSGAGLYWYADLTMRSHAAEFVELELTAPNAGPARPFRPTVLMTRVVDALTRAGTPLTLRGVLDRVTGKDPDIRKALAALVDEGYVAIDNGPNRSHLHRLVKPFTEESE